MSVYVIHQPTLVLHAALPYIQYVSYCCSCELSNFLEVMCNWLLLSANQPILFGWLATNILNCLLLERSGLHISSAVFLRKARKKVQNNLWFTLMCWQSRECSNFFLNFEKIFKKNTNTMSICLFWGDTPTFKPPVTTYDPKYCHNYYFFTSLLPIFTRLRFSRRRKLKYLR